MTALTITTSALVPQSDAVYQMYPGNAAIAAGKSVYLDTTALQVGLFDADSATTAIRTLFGIAVCSSHVAGQPVVVQVGGTLSFGAILTAGTVYCGGATAGDVAPMADLVAGSGWYINTLGVAQSTSIMLIKVSNTGVAE
jgi:hypothetical protein